MRVIHKHRIPLQTGNFILIIPHAKIVSVAKQGDEFYMWTLYDTEEEKEEQMFRIFATDEEIPETIGVSYKFLQTMHMQNGLVWHLFKYTGV